MLIMRFYIAFYTVSYFDPPEIIPIKFVKYISHDTVMCKI